ncbi:hypothetical protein H7X69_02840 [Candidatus Saccharibacteria bacterium]|nr:hypothetical protein [Candidatus Saccharibacteria bacterium]
MQRDYQALQSIVSSHDIASLKQLYPMEKSSAGLERVIKRIFFGFIAMMVVVFYLTVVLAHETWTQFAFIGIGLVCLVLSVWAYRFQQRKLLTTRVRLHRFATANGLKYLPVTTDPPHSGIIFSVGRDRRAENRLMSGQANQYEIANYQYVTGSGKNRSVITYGYICVYLDRNLPNMVLDSKQNNIRVFGAQLSNLPITFHKDQILELEGDFNKYFTLYAPKEYERDALYIFAPDLMALLIDEASTYDVEIVDDRLYVYSNTSFGLEDPAVLERLFKIIATVGKKTVTQTDRYADERTGEMVVQNIVAQPGRRLKRKTGWFLTALTIIYVSYQIIQYFITMFNK